MMIKLRPITGEQTFTIIPSTLNGDLLDDATITFRETGTNVTDNSATFTWDNHYSMNYIEISLTPSVTLKEGQIYSFELKSTTDIYYRDLIYITDNTNKNEVFTLPDNYNQYDDGSDKYVVL